MYVVEFHKAPCAFVDADNLITLLASAQEVVIEQDAEETNPIKNIAKANRKINLILFLIINNTINNVL